MRIRTTVAILSLLLIASLLGLIINSEPVSATPTIIQVPSDDYQTIQEAINNANLGDAILVAAGTYRENVVINQTVTLKGNGRNVTFIEGKDESKAVVNIEINNINVSGFTIRGGSSGISIIGYDGSRISDNRIITNGGEGIWLSSSHNNIIFSNVISFNGFDGINLESASNNLIYDNVVTHNDYAGIDMFEANNNRINNNTVSFHEKGIWPESSNGNSFNGNTVSNNTDGVSIYQCSNNVFYHNDFFNNTYQVDTLSAVNSWNTTAEGNYWSDYTGKDDNGDGIGDTPYIIDPTNQDNFPRMSPGNVPKDPSPPFTTDDYDDLWHAGDFSITLTALDDLSGVAQTYYKINDGSVKNVSVNGYPLIAMENANNTLEYWSVDYAGNEETPRILTEIKLDKTAPTGSVKINYGASYTNSTSVTLTLTTVDTTSGIHQVRFSNDGVWDSEPWEPFSATKEWTLTPSNGTKTVYVQLMDNAGLISQSYSDTIILNILDTIAPTISVTFPLTGSEIKSSTITASWTGSDEASGISHYEIRLDSGSWINMGTNTHTFIELGDGSHTIDVKAIDNAGNARQDTVSFTVNAGSALGPGYLKEAVIAAMIVILALGITLYFVKIRKR